MAEVQVFGLYDLIMSVLTFAALAYFASRGWELLSARFLKPAGAAPPQRVAPSQKSMQELLAPSEKKRGVPDMALADLAAQCDPEGTAKKCLLGCKGRVFDVSSNEAYHPDGGYDLFVGRDASVALARMRFNPECLDPSQLHWSQDLNTRELNVLEDWLIKFEAKYPLVAYIKDDRKLKK